jgi:ribosomal protein S18 acetylase RimI-like enzyme
MTSPNALAVRSSDRQRAVETLVSAFADDPVERWLYPEEAEYLRCFPGFVSAFAGDAFSSGTVWQIDDFAAVAMWLAPGFEPDGVRIVEFLTETVAPDKHEDMLAVLGQMEAAHPTYDHWYLPWLGVEATMRGKGLGSTLLTACLDVVEATKTTSSYLETPNPRTISFYERHGFAFAGRAKAGSCPPVTMMERRPTAPVPA